MDSSTMLLDQLPEDLLAAVMSHLRLEDVLALRLMCRRLAGLAQHPDVWRHRTLAVYGGPGSCPLLRLAPCAREVSTVVPMEPACRHGDLRTTSCAARALSITMGDTLEECGPEEVADTVQIVKQQEALGRLRAVSLHFLGGFLAEETADSLLGALASTRGLEKVTLRVGSRCCWQVVPATGQRGAWAPSLKSFTCDIQPWTVAFCNYMLAGHAATLEAVDFEDHDICPVDATLSPLRLLAGMPNLRQLTCRMMNGLGEVAACESLRALKLTVQPVSDDNSPGALELLRSAHQLRSLHLFFPYDDAEEDDDGVGGGGGEFGADLIRALASSGRSQVEVLSIEVVGSAPQRPLLDQLRLALPSLPALRRLVVDLDPDALLRGITPLTAPSLRSLQIRLYDSTQNVCFHALLHSEKLASLMSRNPLLHVELQYLTCFQDLCDKCVLGCHRDLKSFKLVGVFAHSKDECPSPEDHATNGRCRWVHINDVDVQH
ncbi:uncharacterized protein LOC113202987 [Frankliniella occidentalis]|uniref:Uncharacterized protein LOC113202987 n=1 Tax=Frankliniella occidentalis TaxID=133901 RepID=A0A6J1S360_FRAOC|nr:uncharacterized protein LOC113202987 [Frankliniella occidentalis]